MSTECATHVAYADESHWNVGRHRALAAVSLPLAEVTRLRTEAARLLRESSVSELKWEQIRSARTRFAAVKLAVLALESAAEGGLRVDVLVWDTEDSRHKLPGRDDVANLERMYYHLCKNVLALRWPKGARWRLHPDEHSAMPWQELRSVLENVGSRLVRQRSVFDQRPLVFRLREAFRLVAIEDVVSRNEPLVQIADLFAGLAVFSRERAADFGIWRAAHNGQTTLFETAPATLSGADEQRFRVLDAVAATCSRLGLNVSTSSGLRTYDPSIPANFWWYTPQHVKDKAPVRRRVE